MSQEFKCPVCGWNYDPNAKGKCPSCYTSYADGLKIAEEKKAEKPEPVVAKEQVAPSKPTAQAAPKSSAVSAGSNDLLLDAIERQIAAANRTTYAVRSMVSYVVITVLTTIVGALFVAAGLGTRTLALFVIGVITMLGGTIAALVTLVKEWALSYVPKN